VKGEGFFADAGQVRLLGLQGRGLTAVGDYCVDNKIQGFAVVAPENSRMGV